MDGAEVGGLFVGESQCQCLRIFLLGLDSPEKSVSCMGDKGLATRILGAEWMKRARGMEGSSQQSVHMVIQSLCVQY